MKNRFSLLVLSMIAMLCLTFTTSGNNSGLLPTSSTSSTSPADEATINVELDGLLACAFGNPDRVSVGVLDAHMHTPTITITKIAGATKSTIATITADQLKGNVLSFEVEGGQPTGITRYLTADRDKDLNDFRWTCDLEGDVYQRSLNLRSDRLFAKLHFLAGNWYAGERTDNPVKFVSVNNPGQQLSFNRVIAAPAMALKLTTGQSLMIRGTGINLRLASEPGVRYQISIHNLPPADAQADIAHFSHYYDVIGEKVSEYKPVMVQPVAYAPKPLVCAPTVFSRSRID